MSRRPQNPNRTLFQSHGANPDAEPQYLPIPPEILRKKQDVEDLIAKSMADFIAESGFDIHSMDFDFEHQRAFGSGTFKHVLKRVTLHIGKTAPMPILKPGKKSA